MHVTSFTVAAYRCDTGGDIIPDTFGERTYPADAATDLQAAFPALSSTDAAAIVAEWSDDAADTYR